MVVICFSPLSCSNDNFLEAVFSISKTIKTADDIQVYGLWMELISDRSYEKIQGKKNKMIVILFRFSKFRTYMINFFF